MTYEWIRSLNGPRRAVGAELLKHLPDLSSALDAMRDERWEHAAGLIRASLWADLNQDHARILARQVETGYWQGE